MRKLIVIAEDQYVRNLVAAGAFDDIEDDETYWVSGTLKDPSLLEARGERYLGGIQGTAERRERYIKLRRVILASFRFRSRTQRIKLRFEPWHQRLRLKLTTLPGIQRLEIARLIRAVGRSDQMRAAVERVQPDLVIAPSGGTDNLVFDALREAREFGARSLAIIYNWDNLSSKGSFPFPPDHFAVVGPQSVEHAWRIHRVPAERVSVLGGPYIDHHFHHEAGSTQSPFDFRYALFAGCYMPFDERTSLRLLDRAIEERGLDLTIVYRPHPQRRRRKVDDHVREEDFEHVVIDPQVRDAYEASFDQATDPEVRPPLPALDYYPALLENAEFVICPLSTMVLESAIYDRQVIVIAYHDGVHKDSPGVIVDYDHFQGMDRIAGLHLCWEADDLVALFERLATAPPPLPHRMRDDIGEWIFHDERPYRERLRELVDRLTADLPAPDTDVREPAAGGLRG